MFDFTLIHPWFLSALAVLPVLWFLLRLLPPMPKTMQLPTFFLLKDLPPSNTTSVTTPLWLMILRMLVAALLIFALSRPVFAPEDPLPGQSGPVLFVVDNGWAAAQSWTERIVALQKKVRQLDRQGRSVLILPTAAATDGTIPDIQGPMPAAEAEKFLSELQPQPWSADHIAVRQKLEASVVATHIIFASSGLTLAGTDSLIDRMEKTGVTILDDTKINNPFLLSRAGQTDDGAMLLDLRRPHPAPADKTITLEAIDANGAALDRVETIFPAQDTEIKITLRLPTEIKSRIARLQIAGINSAATVNLTDARWRRGAAGLLSDDSGRMSNQFLSENYYLSRALATRSLPPIEGNITTLLSQNTDTILWPDSVVLNTEDRANLLDWVEKGGTLIRFAGPTLAANPEDPLLPVRLRHGERALQGAMTWEQPQGLGAPLEQSPFFAQAMPQDISITRQILAESDPDVFAKTWLQLQDGTPLVTAGPLKDGHIILVHTSAGPSWSNFCYSGLFVDLLDMAQSIGKGSSAGPLVAQGLAPPLRLLDGFGRLQPPSALPAASPIKLEDVFESAPQHPPGLYGQDGAAIPRNLGEGTIALQPISTSNQTVAYESGAEKDLMPLLLTIALIALVIETFAALALRGALRFAAVMLFCCFTIPAQAQNLDSVAAQAASSIYLAYIETGNGGVDSVSRAGLLGLMQVINSRTSIRIEGVRGVNPAEDALFVYPFLYWPLSSEQPPLSATAARALSIYMAEGGTILFDTQSIANDAAVSSPGQRRLRMMAQEISLPELAVVEKTHILGKSFYLLDAFPGVYNGADVWAEREPNPGHDSVPSVVIGGNDWAAAWSQRPEDRRRFPITPGGERQREMAYRFGVNFMMMVLAGNYKSDQVHVPFILERMKK